MFDSVLIIGAGHAGAIAAERLRREGYEGRIALIGGEPSLPYERLQARWACCHRRRRLHRAGGYRDLPADAARCCRVRGAERLLGRVVAPVLSTFYAAEHAAQGVQIRCNSAVAAFVGTHEIREVILASGERIPADLIVTGL